jgi:signal transduction histidine kinase
MSHEFRTPLNSIMALARLLLDRTDGELVPEQEKQVGFIRKAAEDLTELVNDLLDLAKVEAGRIDVNAIEFEISDLFGALRGMLRPLLVGESVRLVFDEPAGIPTLYGDEGKVSQILRNFLSNALKFTERGEIRVSAVLAAVGEPRRRLLSRGGDPRVRDLRSQRDLCGDRGRDGDRNDPTSAGHRSPRSVIRYATRSFSGPSASRSR